MLRKLESLRMFSTKAKNSIYVTTPIFYVNADPHIGHLYSAIIADTICRYKKLRHNDVTVHLTTGTDEHGSKIQQAAASHNTPLPQYCDNLSLRYRQIFQEAQVQFTDFIRTSENRHKQAVQHFWDVLKAKGLIYSSQYSGWYCISDETFLTNTQIKEDPVSGIRYSLESGNIVEWTDENNYIFRLSTLQDEVMYWIKQGCIRPLKFEKILLDMLQKPFPDISISRPVNRVHWAISVPGDATQTVYVWLDALVNYLSSIGYPEEQYLSHWPPTVQIIGKDILKFHGIYWPAFLIGAGLEPPQQIFVHSHWTVEGQKMSKSKNNQINPKEVADIFSMEGLRYFLLREGVAHSDGNYSNSKVFHVLNSELADTLGNLLSRVCGKSLNPKQVYPRLHETHLKDILQMNTAQRLEEALNQLSEKCTKHYDENNFYLVVDTVTATLRASNNFFENLKPWELKKNIKTLPSKNLETNENAYRLETIIAMTMDSLRLCGIALQPIIPQLSSKLLNKLKVQNEERTWAYLKVFFDRNTAHLERPLGVGDAVLFPRILLKNCSINLRN